MTDQENLNELRGFIVMRLEHDLNADGDVLKTKLFMDNGNVITIRPAVVPDKDGNLIPVVKTHLTLPAVEFIR